MADVEGKVEWAGSREPTGQFVGADGMRQHPPSDQWDDWVEYESTAWPRKVEKHYMIIPTVCFNCEAACGLLAYVDKETLEIRKFEGNPHHPGSRGRNCAKGPATLSQIQDPERILYPQKRVGPRGSGRWERVTWDQVLDDIGGRIRDAIKQDRRNEVVYHVGRPGEDGFADRMLFAWGIDGHNSHTNVCSSSARVGYAAWMGNDRPSPDHANAQFILLISSHLETGHYFNPHAQRITEGRMAGAKLAVMDPRLSNTASMADYWMPTWPGSEAAVLLAMAKLLLDNDWYDADYLRRWTNWEQFMVEVRPDEESTFENFVASLKQIYAEFTPEFAEQESGVPAETILTITKEVAKAGKAFASHTWRAATAGNLGGWQVARCLFFLHVLTGSVGTKGGMSPNWWNKFVPASFIKPPPNKEWNEMLWPREYPLAHHEMSILLPHFLKEGRGRLQMYFTRVYNPVWTNPDGFTWMEVLKDESKIACHAHLSPMWSETAQFADYVLPMGLGPERHDTHSYETHNGRWLGFRQPVLRVAMEKMGKPVEFTYEANPGEVWDESEFWIELSWRIDPDGSMGIRKFFESPYRPGQKITVDEYYGWMFENSVPGLPAAAEKEGLTPMQYMRKYGAFEIDAEVYENNEVALSGADLEGTHIEAITGAIKKTYDYQADGHMPVIGDPEVVGTMVDGEAKKGFPTPSGKLEIYSKTMADYGWPDQSLPGYMKSHVHFSNLDRGKGEYVLLPTFRLPTLVHTRSANSKWLTEISHSHPLWIHTEDAEMLKLATGDLVRITTDIGYFVIKAMVTEGIRPGIVAASHHMGRWRVQSDQGVDRWASALVDVKNDGGKWMVRQLEGVKPFESSDPDSKRIWWNDAGVHQNLTFPVHPDPVSGMHCWHQKVTVSPAHPEDQYADIFVDTDIAHRIYKEWLEMTRPGPYGDGMRRPMWIFRPVKPHPSAYKV